MSTTNAFRTFAYAVLVFGHVSFVVASPEDHGSHDEHDDHEAHQHDDHGEEENRTRINPQAAQAAGIRVSQAGPQQISEHATLTGRIRMNPNALAQVRARFPGLVQRVDVNLGDRVKKGSVLAVVEANDSLENYQLLAPTDGVVVERNSFPGTMTGEQPLFVIAQLSEVWAEFHVFSRDLSQVSVGQSVRVHTLERDQTAQASLSLLLPTADEASQSVLAVASLKNDDDQWRPGITVYGDVSTAEFSAPVAVPEEAVQRMENNAVVFVQEGEFFEARSVTLGRSDGDYVEVLSGLEAGESYVSQGSFTVKADISKQSAGHDHH